jgi:hypothetical protein
MVDERRIQDFGIRGVPQRLLYQDDARKNRSPHLI